MLPCPGQPYFESWCGGVRHVLGAVGLRNRNDGGYKSSRAYLVCSMLFLFYVGVFLYSSPYLVTADASLVEGANNEVHLSLSWYRFYLGCFGG